MRVLLAVVAALCISTTAYAGQKIESMMNSVRSNCINEFPTSPNYASLCIFKARQILVMYANQCAATGITEASPKFSECMKGASATYVAQQQAQEQARQQTIYQQQLQQYYQQQQAIAAAQAQEQRRQMCIAAALLQGGAPRVGEVVTFGSALANTAQCY